MSMNSVVMRKRYVMDNMPPVTMAVVAVGEILNLLHILVALPTIRVGPSVNVSVSMLKKDVLAEELPPPVYKP